MILWLLGVEILAFVEADACFFLGEMKPELKVRFLAEPEKAVLFTVDEELLCPNGGSLSPCSKSSGLGNKLSFSLAGAETFSESEPSFFKAVFSVWDPCAAFEQNFNIPELEIFSFQL